MQRLDQKVKDIVEVRSFSNLQDFAADPVLTLSRYCFTDITADLIVTWIDRIMSVRAGNGNAVALAGFRGVGKSHFLAAISSLLTKPELRSNITDSYVAASAERLHRRPMPVGFVRRGAGPSLLSELKDVIAGILDIKASDLSDSLYEILLRATEKCGDQTLVLFIDTAYGRRDRVSRDDGDILSEIAEAAKKLGIFVGVALDDDISGADGANASITQCFAIDYLDQEHLYKIVDVHIFSKNTQTLPVLHEIYENYRSTFPGFKWSEQRFVSLYPLHPATLEIAPLIRLYVQDFALLGFASEAGVKILGRPANSLIGLDEVFDLVEKKLRSADELKDAFETLDKIEKELLPNVPVHSRLTAKLALKGLFLLSLNGQGAAVPEVEAAMLLNDGGADFTVESFFNDIVQAQPDLFEVSGESDSKRFGFRLSSGGDIESVFNDAVENVSDEQTLDALYAIFVDKYAGGERAAVIEAGSLACTTQWNGSIRRGAITWATEHESSKFDLDWSINILPAGSAADDPGQIYWRLGTLSADDLRSIKRAIVLQTDPSVRERLNARLNTALHTATLAVEKIWLRIFLDEGKLTKGADEFRFNDETRSAHGLAQMMTIMLDPIFRTAYVDHPIFPETLTGKTAAALISGFFGGSTIEDPQTQHLADRFAAPLGLAEKIGELWTPLSADKIMSIGSVVTSIDTTELDSGAIVDIEGVRRKLAAAPYGFTRETQNLLLSTLASAKKIEFVTSSGNRINHRSLDLQVLWDDIVGIAKPLNEHYSVERLISWAKLITGNSGIRSVDRSEDRLLIIDSLSGWLAGWNEERSIAEFDKLPDELLNARIWKIASGLKKSLGLMSERIDSLISSEITLDECLHSIAGIFADSQEQFEKKRSDLRALRTYVDEVKEIGKIRRYMTLAEPTNDLSIESERTALIANLESAEIYSRNEKIKDAVGTWKQFLELYKDHYSSLHDQEMNKKTREDSLREFRSSIAFKNYQAVSNLPQFDSRIKKKVSELLGNIRFKACSIDVSEALETEPSCICGFRLDNSESGGNTVKNIEDLIESGTKKLRSNLSALTASGDLSRAQTDSIDRVLSALSASGSYAIDPVDLIIVKSLGNDGKSHSGFDRRVR